MFFQCQQWNCINTKLGLPNSLPPREQFDIALRSLLPEGEWQDVVNKVLDTCYGHHPRMYTNSCPGQALLHCAVENLIEVCAFQVYTIKTVYFYHLQNIPL